MQSFRKNEVLEYKKPQPVEDQTKVTIRNKIRKYIKTRSQKMTGHRFDQSNGVWVTQNYGSSGRLLQFLSYFR